MLCDNCKAGDHSHHVEGLGGICIGCACPDTVPTPEPPSEAPRNALGASGSVPVAPSGAVAVSAGVCPTPHAVNVVPPPRTEPVPDDRLPAPGHRPTGARLRVDADRRVRTGVMAPERTETMTAELLRRAATAMRADHPPEHERHEMWQAMGDWLDVTERDVGTSSLAYHAALAVARIYLGEPDD